MLLGADLALAQDAARFARQVGVVPDPWQERVLRSRAPRILLNCCRQSGKSTTAAILALHTALYEPRSVVLVLSPSLRQSQELFRTCRRVYQQAGRPVLPETESALRLELANDSRIVSLPGREGTVRGFSGVQLLIIDEASRVDDALYAAVRPMLAVSQGRLVALSTPFGRRGWWHQAWSGPEAWERYAVPATACPRITAAFLAEEQRAMGAWWYQQEYGCAFLDAEAQAFTRADVARAFVEAVDAWAL
jgi:hypothetical protein